MPNALRRLASIACLLIGAAAVAAPMDGSLPLYPNGRNMNRGMPAAPAGTSVPMVLETDDAVAVVDAWYRSNAPQGCARSAASGGIKYTCPGGSIVIYAKGKTQVALVPSMPSFLGR